MTNTLNVNILRPDTSIDVMREILYMSEQDLRYINFKSFANNSRWTITSEISDLLLNSFYKIYGKTRLFTNEEKQHFITRCIEKSIVSSVLKKEKQEKIANCFIGEADLFLEMIKIHNTIVEKKLFEIALVAIKDMLIWEDAGGYELEMMHTCLQEISESVIISDEEIQEHFDEVVANAAFMLTFRLTDSVRLNSSSKNCLMYTCINEFIETYFYKETTEFLISYVKQPLNDFITTRILKSNKVIRSLYIINE